MLVVEVDFQAEPVLKDTCAAPGNHLSDQYNFELVLFKTSFNDWSNLFRLIELIASLLTIDSKMGNNMWVEIENNF